MQETMAVLIIVLLLLVIGFRYRMYITENFISPHLYTAGPTRCFSCERDLINRYGYDYAYLGKPTKCFDCEREIAGKYGHNYANLTQPTRCFSCEQHFL